MFAQTPPVKTIHGFFKQQRTIRNYIELKRQESIAEKEYAAAVKVQARYRGWLVRKNFTILQDSAIKIQAGMRGTLARRRVTEMKQKIQQQLEDDLRTKSAIIIQAAWRGYWSRKHKLDFKKYKAIQAKNAELENSIKKLNELEEALLAAKNKDSSSTLSDEGFDRMDELFGGENGTGANVEDLCRLSPVRLAELFACLGEKSGNYKTCKTKVDKLLGKEMLDARDSIAKMFPEYPDGVNLVHPDPEKVAALKNAIRLLRQKIKEREATKMGKYHYLLRTAAIPGVYSDICSRKLTDIEKKLKEMKFPRNKVRPLLPEEQERPPGRCKPRSKLTSPSCPTTFTPAHPRICEFGKRPGKAGLGPVSRNSSDCNIKGQDQECCNSGFYFKEPCICVSNQPEPICQVQQEAQCPPSC